MYRSCLIAMAALSILILFSGCAKKNQQVEEVVATEPTVAEPVQKEQPAPEVVVAEKDPLEEAGLFTLEADNLQIVFFAYDSHQLSIEAMASLKTSAEMLSADPTFKVIVAGHCDERGSDEYNMSLGELRARAVKNYLVSLGIEKDRLQVISYGEEKPAVIGSDEAAWEKNRRVEFN